MSKSFYHYMMKYRNEQGRDELALFSQALYHDHGFPKQSSNYDEVSSYLELNTSYIMSMALFDEAWDLYEADR